MKLNLIIITFLFYNITFTAKSLAVSGYSVPVHFENIQNNNNKNAIINNLSKDDGLFILDLSSEMGIYRHVSNKPIKYIKSSNRIFIDIQKNRVTKNKSNFHDLYGYYDGIKFKYRRSLNINSCEYSVDYVSDAILKKSIPTVKHKVNFYTNLQSTTEKKQLESISKPSNIFKNLFRYLKINRNNNELIYINEDDRLVYKYLYNIDLKKTDNITLNLDPNVNSLNIKFNDDGNKFLSWHEIVKEFKGDNVTLYIKSSIQKKYPEFYRDSKRVSYVEFIIFGNKNHKIPINKPLGEYLYISKVLPSIDFNFDTIINLRTEDLKNESWNYKFNNQIIEGVNFGNNVYIIIESPNSECIKYLDISFNHVDELLIPTSILQATKFFERIGLENTLFQYSNLKDIKFPILLDYYRTSFDNDNIFNIKSSSYNHSTHLISRIINRGTKLLFVSNGDLNSKIRIKLNFNNFSTTLEYDGRSNIIDLSTFDGSLLETFEVLSSSGQLINDRNNYEFFLVNFKEMHFDQIFSIPLPNTNLNLDENNNAHSYNKKNNIIDTSILFNNSDLIKFEYKFLANKISPCIYINDLNNILIDKLCFNNNEGIIWVKKNSEFYNRISRYNKIYLYETNNKEFSIVITSYKFNLPSIKSQLLEYYTPTDTLKSYKLLNLDENLFLDYIKGSTSLFFLGSMYEFISFNMNFKNNNIGKINKIEYFGNYKSDFVGSNSFKFLSVKNYSIAIIIILLSSVFYFLSRYLRSSLFVVKLKTSNYFLVTFKVLILISFFIFLLSKDQNYLSIIIFSLALLFILLFKILINIYKFNLNYTFIQFNILGIALSLILMTIFYLLGLQYISEAFGLAIFFFICDSLIISLLNVKK